MLIFRYLEDPIAISYECVFSKLSNKAYNKKEIVIFQARVHGFQRKGPRKIDPTKKDHVSEFFFICLWEIVINDFQIPR